MFNTKISSGDDMFKDALYRQTHDNVTEIKILRSSDTLEISIVFCIHNEKRTKLVYDIQRMLNKDLHQYSIENITFKANKFASMIDRVPEYIPDEQVARWIECKL
jgi:hypothetical protein